MINRPGDLVRIKRNDRMTILRAFINELCSMNDLSIINIAIDKNGKPNNYNVMEKAGSFVAEFSNTMSHHNSRALMPTIEVWLYPIILISIWLKV